MANLESMEFINNNTVESKEALNTSVWPVQKKPYVLLTIPNSTYSVPCDWMLVPIVLKLWSKGIITRGWDQGQKVFYTEPQYAEITIEKKDNNDTDYDLITSLFHHISIVKLESKSNTSPKKHKESISWIKSYPNKIIWTQYVRFNRLIFAQDLIPRIASPENWSYAIYNTF